MKRFVAFEQFNAFDYLGSRMILCKADAAEYEVVLNEGDKLVEYDDGISLVRNGIWYSQDDKMNTFKGVNFFDRDDPQNNVQLKLLKCN